MVTFVLVRIYIVMKILITGAAGFIGSHMAETLSQQGHHVWGIDNFAPYYDRSLKEKNRDAIVAAGVHFIQGDLIDELGTLLPNDIEVIYHFAAQPGISSQTSFHLFERNNILATQNLLDWSLSLGTVLKMFVNISTSSVYGTEAVGNEEMRAKPVSDYGVTKLAAEQFVLAANRIHKIPACSMRLYSVYGPRERPEKLYSKLIKALLENQSFPLYEGSEQHQRSFSYVKDIVGGLASILSHLDECNGEIVNMGSEEVYSTAQGIALVEELLGKKAVIIKKERRSGDQLKTSANISKARQLLSYKNTTTFREGLQAQINWYQETFK